MKDVVTKFKKENIVKGDPKCFGRTLRNGAGNRNRTCMSFDTRT